MTSIKCTDMSGEHAKDLESHLKDADFFSTDSFPDASFTLTGGTPVATDENGNNFEIRGNLVIKGISNEITFPATLSHKDKQLDIKGTVVFDRTRWGIKYKSKTMFDDLGDKFIYDDVELNVQLTADLQ